MILELNGLFACVFLQHVYVFLVEIYFFCQNRGLRGLHRFRGF